MKIRYRAMTTRGKHFVCEKWWECIVGIADTLQAPMQHIRILSRTVDSWYIWESESEFLDDVKHSRRTLWVAVVQMEQIK